MSKISFILRQNSSTTTKRTVYVKHAHKASPFAKSTGVEVEPAFFSLETGKVSGKLTNSPEMNETISTVYNDVARAARNIIGWGSEPNRANMAKEYAAIVTNRLNTAASLPRLAKFRESQLDTLREELEAAKAEVRRLEREIVDWEIIDDSYTDKLFVTFLHTYRQNVVMARSTAASYASVENDFKLYNPSLKFEEMNNEVLLDYEKYLIARKMNNVTIKTYVSKIKTVYRYYAEKQRTNPTALDTHKMQTKRLKDVPVVYLTKEEVQALSTLSFESKSVESVRDLMLFMCQTGLRYSDAFVTKKMIIGKYIVLTTKKTDTKVEIPLSPVAKQILEKYDYEMPRYRLNYFNRVIKRICERIPSMADEIAHVVSKSGTETTSEPVRRCDAISAHVGRKTFATHALASGVNPAVLKGWLGHSKMELMLNHYANSKHNSIAEMDKVMGSMS